MERRETTKVGTSLLYRAIMRLRPAPLGALLKKLFHIKRVYTSTGEINLYVDPVSQFGITILESGEYELETSRAIRNYVKQGDMFLDIGANEGYFSLLAAKLVGDDGRVYAIEPQTRLKPILLRNFQINQVRNVRLVPCAISDKVGTVPIYLSPNINSGASGLNRTTRYSVQTERVHSLTLSELFSLLSLEFCDALKLDVEGFEYEAIMGSQAIFRERRVGVIILELHSALLQKRHLNPQVIVRFLHECGYSRDIRFGTLVFTCANQSC
jgi:FkbM family methyltransferase